MLFLTCNKELPFAPIVRLAIFNKKNSLLLPLDMWSMKGHEAWEHSAFEIFDPQARKFCRTFFLNKKMSFLTSLGFLHFVPMTYKHFISDI